nr:mitochondrial import inner membrane translocase subunit TIM23-2-like [Ipomoea batatas]
MTSRSQIQNLYKLPTTPEFLFEEESRVQRRSWGENLTYYTGIGYLAGTTFGGAKGFYQGAKASEPGDSLKLRVNRILNGSGHNGRKFGNRAGVIGLLYAGMESGMVAVRDTDDVINSVVAGLGTGALYRAAAGLSLCRFRRDDKFGMCGELVAIALYILKCVG